MSPRTRSRSRSVIVVDALAVDENRARVGSKQPENEFEQHRLPGAAGAEQDRHAAFRHTEADIAEDDVVVERRTKTRSKNITARPDDKLFCQVVVGAVEELPDGFRRAPPTAWLVFKSVRRDQGRRRAVDVLGKTDRAVPPASGSAEQDRKSAVTAEHESNRALHGRQDARSRPESVPSDRTDSARATGILEHNRGLNSM